MRPLIDVIDELPSGVDQFYVADKDDAYYYSWINKKPDNLERMKTIWGYEVVAGKHKESALAPPNSAGEHVNGDLILCRMPRARYEKIALLKKNKANSQVQRASEEWKTEATKAGLLVEDSTVSETISQNILGGGKS